MKRLIFLLVFLSLPIGAKGQVIIKCDTSIICGRIWWGESGSHQFDTVIYCDTNWIELKKFLNSDFAVVHYPNWQDSIEQCKTQIAKIKVEFNQLIDDLWRSGGDWDRWQYQDRLITESAFELKFLRLQLQIFQLRAILEKEGVR